MKNTNYFSHDINARNDPKLLKVLIKLGQEGKGVYWDLIEMLYEQGGYLLISDIEVYTNVLRTNNECITALISDFGLFEKDDFKFWSNSVLGRLLIRKEKSIKAVESINKRWSKEKDSEKDTNVLPTYYEGNTIKKETKVNETKKNTGNESKGQKRHEVHEDDPLPF